MHIESFNLLKAQKEYFFGQDDKISLYLIHIISFMKQESVDQVHQSGLSFLFISLSFASLIGISFSNKITR